MPKRTISVTEEQRKYIQKRKEEIKKAQKDKSERLAYRFENVRL